MSMNGQRVMIVGGSSGMGLATARAAALEGAQVTIASRSRERVDAALQALPEGCTGVTIDVRDEEHVAEILERSEEIDHLVFTAGDDFTPRPLAELDLEESADKAAIRARYAELVKRCHPDANGGDRSAEQRLQRVLKAYKTLQKAGMA